MPPNNANNPTRFIVRCASAQMPSSCWGRYRRVAVLEITPEANPETVRIDGRSRGVVRVVATWERLHTGKTDRCAYRVAMLEARAMADSLNASKVVSSGL